MGLPGDRFLTWWTRSVGAGPSLERSVEIRLFDTHAFARMPAPRSAYSELSEEWRFYPHRDAIASLGLSAALSDGKHRVDVPPVLRELGELLLLVDSTAEGRRENHCDQMHLRLWLLDLEAGTLTILPQDWFNQGAYDFGYQWVTRVARAPATGAIVGEGIRLGIFVLDGSGRRVKEWLHEYVFYQPNRARG